jgi:hypothetical protein
MSAKLETFFELKKVVDHDCGNYQIGEIDFVNYAKIREYVSTYGDLGYQQLIDVCVRIMSEAQDQARIERSKEYASQEVSVKLGGS